MIISSQHYINWAIVEEKMEEIKNKPFVVIPCYNIGEVDGVEMAIQADGHHTLTAARELGIEVKFEIADEPEHLTGEAALEAHYNDGDWYNVETSDPSINNFDFIW